MIKKNVVLLVVAGTFMLENFSEAGMMENCKIKFRDGYCQWVDEYDKVLTFKEKADQLGLYDGLKLPTTQEEMERFYEIYSQNSAAQLDYCTNFWLIQKKNALDLFFACTSVKDISSWLQTVRQFVKLLEENSNIIFRIRILKSYFKIWAESIKELRNCTDTQVILIPIEELKEGLKTLLDEANKNAKNLIQGIDL